jgi:ABC-type bacteriocin/lantibiotic exporter with double-glycine peptidase domain
VGRPCGHPLRAILLVGALAGGCAGALGGCYVGAAREASLDRIAADPDWRIVRGVPFIPQRGDVDCGAAALAMVLTHDGVPTSPSGLLAEAPPAGGGIAAGQLRAAARRRGLAAYVVSGTWDDLEQQVTQGRPVVVGLLKPILGGRARAHYEVVIGFNRKQRRVLSLDPAAGLREYSAAGFAREWAPAREVTLIVLPRQA